MSRPILVAALFGLGVGVALAQDDAFVELGNRLSELSDRRDPNRVVTRGFEAIIDVNVQVSNSLSGLIERQPEVAYSALRKASDLCSEAAEEFNRLMGIVDPDSFSPVVLQTT